ncbi:hypothetical protein NP233_g8255 [Leucocoprinus birnbaumii]|uniref:Uncharacterized protein n=1 Tax=Leucocoprinus birnbaumii TaxID=56174 RepID=A0AAD5VML7_9AGAR|nr:hypothetical protein NP233_g8255 [Leucocoprinus birnbaumii]
MSDKKSWNGTQEALKVTREGDTIVIWHFMRYSMLHVLLILSTHVMPKTQKLELSLYSFGLIWAIQVLLTRKISHSEFISYNGYVHQAEIIMVTIDWAHPGGSLEKKEERETEFATNIGERLARFERLEGTSVEDCWEFVRRVTSRRGRHLDRSDSESQDVIAQVKPDMEDWRVEWIQREIDELYIELDKTPDGRFMRQRLKRASVDQSRYLESILARTDNEDLGEEERQRLEEKMEEEYVLSRKEFQRYFEDIRETEIAIGPYLREFYKLPPPASTVTNPMSIFTNGMR